MSQYHWDHQFTKLFERCLARYRVGDTDFTNYYGPEDLGFLTSIGYKPREFFDFVEDHGDEGEPSLATAIMIASARRDYLDVVMRGRLSDHEVTPAELPAKDSILDGYRWLPRILVKARAKLRGELHPDIMYCCGGDRAFLREHDVAPADFLRVVWAADGDDAKVVAYLNRQPA